MLVDRPSCGFALHPPRRKGNAHGAAAQEAIGPEKREALLRARRRSAAGWSISGLLEFSA